MAARADARRTGVKASKWLDEVEGGILEARKIAFAAGFLGEQGGRVMEEASDRTGASAAAATVAVAANTTAASAASRDRTWSASGGWRSIGGDCGREMDKWWKW